MVQRASPVVGTLKKARGPGTEPRAGSGGPEPRSQLSPQKPQDWSNWASLPARVPGAQWGDGLAGASKRLCCVSFVPFLWMTGQCGDVRLPQQRTTAPAPAPPPDACSVLAGQPGPSEHTVRAGSLLRYRQSSGLAEVTILSHLFGCLTSVFSDVRMWNIAIAGRQEEYGTVVS